MQGKQRKYVIVAVLNWGLGHATRMEPLIEHLQQQGFTPVLASDGVALTYLKKQFPHLAAEALYGYNIRYTGTSFLLGMLRQLPKIARAVHKEHKQLERLVEQYGAEGVVSDNRLGGYSKGVPSVYITHQLNIRAGLFSAFAGWLHRRYINRFAFCVIPDVAEEEGSLAGALSHPVKLNIPYAYVGPLSRFADREVGQERELIYKACIILSGPEPSRSVWEAAICAQAKQVEGKVLLIRGTTLATMDVGYPPNMEVIGLADREALIHALQHSEVVVSRSGYSSLMDYCFIQKPVFIVPTPGQSEQEFLAERMRVYCAVQEQDAFDLQAGIQLAKAKAGLYCQVESRPVDWEALFSLFQRK
jgi:UDP:flavonoid glycosyltransferase YjiC (YdhE family)